MSWRFMGMCKGIMRRSTEHVSFGQLAKPRACSLPLSLSTCIHIHTVIFICMVVPIFRSIYLCQPMSLSISTSTSISVYECVYICIYMCVCKRVYIYICRCTLMYTMQCNSFVGFPCLTMSGMFDTEKGMTNSTQV